MFYVKRMLEKCQVLGTDQGKEENVQLLVLGI